MTGPAHPDIAVTAYSYAFGQVVFDPARLELRVRGKPVPLEHKPLRVLHELLRHAGDVVTKQELLDLVWDGRPTVENVLANAVAKLRKALGETESAMIVTVPRIGYRLVARVERREAENHADGQFVFEEGRAVPGRRGRFLSRRLHHRPDCEIWLARDAGGGNPSVFKFCRTGEPLPNLKREAAVSRMIAEGLTAAARRGVVRVLSWNFQTPPFFIESEYGGVDLADWAEHSGILETLDRKARIGLFLQIARTVGAAHTLGILHKDLKPSNVLVEREPAHADGWRLRLTDFGSSRLLDPGRLADLGLSQLGVSDSLLGHESAGGTPLYLAPEVVGGAVATVLSDIYALGILLYQMLVGDLRRPMATGWEALISDEPLRQDVADSTAGDPHRRLQSATELIQRLESLDQRRRALQIRRDEKAALEQAQRALVRQRERRPWMIAAAAALVAGLTGMSTLYLQADRERTRAERINTFWNEELVRAINPNAGGGLTLADVLDRAAARLPDRFPDDHATRAAVHTSLGSAYLGLIRQADGMREFERALASYELAYGQNSREALLARLQLARAQIIASRLEEGSRTLEQALELAEPLATRSARVRTAAAWTQGSMESRNDRWSEAVAHFEDAVRLQESADNVAPRDWFKLRMELVDGYRRLSRHSEALALLDQMLDRGLDPEQVGPGRIAVARLQRGQIMLDQGRLADADRAIRAALKELRAAFGDKAFNVNVAIYDLADLNRKLQRWEDALTFARQAAAGFREQLGDRHIVTFKADTMLGLAQLNAGRTEEAIRTLAATVDGVHAVAGAESASAHSPRYFYALALVRGGACPRARPLLDKLDPQALRADFPADNWEVKLSVLRSIVDWHCGNRDSALPHLRQMATTLRQSNEHPVLARLVAAIQLPGH